MLHGVLRQLKKSIKSLCMTILGEPKMAACETDVFVWAPRKMRIWKN